LNSVERIPMPESSMSQPADPRDVESIDAIIIAAYDVISGPAGKKHDWDRERSLFYPGARIMPTARVPGRNDVELEPQLLDVEMYIARVEPLLQQGFYETEVARVTEQFGRIAHVWSIYESRHGLTQYDTINRVLIHCTH